MGKAITWLRWVCAVPGAFLGAWVAYLVFGLAISLSSFGGGIEGTAFERLILQGGSGLVIGFAYMEAGRRIAPARDLPVGGILAAIGAGASLLILGPAVAARAYWSLLQLLAIFIGIGANFWRAYLRGGIGAPPLSMQLRSFLRYFK